MHPVPSQPCPIHDPATSRKGHPMNRAILPLLLLLCAAGLRAVDNVQVNVTLTIDASLSVVWCDNAGNNDTTTAQTWALGTAVALSTTYDTDTGDGTNATGGTGASAPTYKYLQNLSNTTIDVDVTCANSTPSNWSKAAVGANGFLMSARVGGAGGYTSLAATYTDAINDLTASTVSGVVDLQLATPSSVTVGGGVAQTIAVTLTASVAN